MSTLKADTIQSTSGGAATLTKQTAAKHFCVFDGTSTAAVDTSFNNSSLTDNGTGHYTITVTNAFSSIHFAVTGATVGNNEAYNYIGTDATVKTASTADFKCWQYDGNVNDTDTVDIVSHGDLA